MVAIWTLLLFELVGLGEHKLWTAFREGGRHLVKCLYKGCEPGGRGRARFKACLTNELKLSGKGSCSQAERRAVHQRVALPGRLRWRPMRHRILSRREKIHPRVSCRRSNENKNKLENWPLPPSGTTPSRTGVPFHSVGGNQQTGSWRLLWLRLSSISCPQTIHSNFTPTRDSKCSQLNSVLSNLEWGGGRIQGCSDGDCGQAPKLGPRKQTNKTKNDEW